MQKILFILTLISSTLMLHSCNQKIFEDRVECPCSLTLDLSSVSPSMGELYLWAFNGDGDLILRDTIQPYFFGREYRLNIERRAVNYFIWSNLGLATELIEDNSNRAQLSKIDGLSADSLYSYTSELDLNVEEARDIVEMCKEFAQVDVTVKDGNSSMWVEFVGNSYGYNLNSSVLQGINCVNVYSANSSANNYFNYSFRILRQQELEEVKLNLYENIGKKIGEDVGDHVGDHILLNSFSIGKWLQEQGYNMSSENLSDIYIEIDCSNNYVTIKAEDWIFTTSAYVEI